MVVAGVDVLKMIWTNPRSVAGQLGALYVTVKVTHLKIVRVWTSNLTDRQNLLEMQQMVWNCPLEIDWVTL